VEPAVLGGLFRWERLFRQVKPARDGGLHLSY
jgi:hypothetical protein